MRNSKNILQEEWEAVILAGVILLLLAALVWSASGARPARPASQPPPLASAVPAAVPQDLFAGLAGDPASPRPRNPFQFIFSYQVPEPAPPPVRNVPLENPVRPRPEPAPPAPLLEEEAPAVPVQPVFKIQPARVTYVFSQQDRTGKTTAVVKISRRDGKTEMQTPATGEQILGMTVLLIRDESLLLLDASGKQLAIPFGEAKTVMIKHQTH